MTPSWSLSALMGGAPLPAIAHATSTEPLWFLGGLVYVHLDGGQTGEAFALAERRARRGDMPPLHVHHRDDETFHLVEGELTVHVGEQTIALAAGQTALAPRGLAHTYRVESETARWLLINSPAGFERFLRAAGERATGEQLPPEGQPTDPATLAQLAAEQGIEILGPPGALPAGQQR
jgi:quercetin dioxygenase-like cupin family protein